MATQIRGLKFWKWDDAQDGFLVKGSPFVYKFKYKISDKMKAYIKQLPDGIMLRLSVDKDKNSIMWVRHFATDRYKVQARAKSRRAKAWQESATLQAEGGASVGLSTSNRPGGVQTGGAMSAGGGVGKKRSDKTTPKARKRLGEDI